MFRIHDTLCIGILAPIVVPGPGGFLIPDLLTLAMAVSSRSVLVSVFELGGGFVPLSVPLALMVPVAILVAPRRGCLL